MTMNRWIAVTVLAAIIGFAAGRFSAPPVRGPEWDGVHKFTRHSNTA